MGHPLPRKSMLLLIAMFLVIQPMLVVAQVLPGQVGHSPEQPMAAMEHCPSSSAEPLQSGSQETEESCAGGMSLQDCSLAANQGSCTPPLTALIPGGITPDTRLTSGQAFSNRDNRYRSVVLDTLTPPPNSSLV